MEFGEELQRRKFFQVEGGLCDQPLESTEDVVRKGAEGCVGNVTAGTNTNKLMFNTGGTVISCSQSMPFSTDIFSVYRVFDQ